MNDEKIKIETPLLTLSQRIFFLTMPSAESMQKTPLAHAIISLMVLLAAGCREETGTSYIPASNTNRTARILMATELEVNEAVESAFNRLRYRDMMLEPATNLGFKSGFVLSASTAPVGFVALGKNDQQQAPYYADFHITTTSVGTGQTAVTVRTIRARVIDGKEIGVHGGWANHFRDFHPILQEETNVVSAIAVELRPK